MKMEDFLMEHGKVKPMPKNSDLVSIDIPWRGEMLKKAEQGLVDKLKELEIADKLIAERDRLLDLLLCPTHGRCVPHAIEQIEWLKATAVERDNIRLRIKAVDAEHADMERQKHVSIQAFLSIEKQLAQAQAQITWMQTVGTDQVNTIRSLREQLHALHQK